MIKEPPFDIFQEPIYDVNQIKKILPHRHPFLMVDKILDVGENYIIGLKNVTMDEPFFAGHFPDEPIMPGVLQVEAMAQTGGIFVLQKFPDPKNYSTYFLKINNVRFRSKVIPGDTLIFSIEMTTPIKRGISTLKGKAFVGNRVVMEGELTAQVIKTKE